MVGQFGITALTGAIGARFADMCFRITPSLREYYNYRGISAELERRGFGSSRPQLSWAIQQKQRESDKPVGDQNKGMNSSSANTRKSN